MDGRPIKDKGEICPDCGQWSLSRSSVQVLPRGSISPGEGTGQQHRQTGWGSVGACWGHQAMRGSPLPVCPTPGPSLHQQGKLGAIKSRASHTPSRQTEDELGSLEQPERRYWSSKPRTQAPRATNPVCTFSPRVWSEGKQSHFTAWRGLRSSGWRCVSWMGSWAKGTLGINKGSL